MGCVKSYFWANFRRKLLSVNSTFFKLITKIKMSDQYEQFRNFNNKNCS